MKCLRARIAAGLSAITLTGSLAASEQDVSVDKLLSKLPPPEKLAKPPVQRALEQPDPAVRDAIVRQIIQSLVTRRWREALNLSRKLTERYPQSAGAFCLRGAIALDMRQLSEASSAFRTATNINPRLSLAHFELAVVEGDQGHFGAAIPHLKKVAELEPKLYLPYFALSDCAWQLGRKQESLDYARKSTSLAPSLSYTWIELARAENGLGHSEATLADIAKAAEVSPDNGYMLAVVGYSYMNLNHIPQAIPPLERAAHFSPNDFLIQSQLVTVCLSQAILMKVFHTCAMERVWRQNTDLSGNTSDWLIPAKAIIVRQ
jgi:tetratricopeptide (TPR) repeat protein